MNNMFHLPADRNDTYPKEGSSSLNIVPPGNVAKKLRDHESKIESIRYHFREIMIALGLDVTDDSLRDTPDRVAAMYVNELFSGLDTDNEPDSWLADNKYNYREMLVEKNLTVFSSCEHHFLPIVGKAHVAYFSNGKVIGLSKINQIVQYYSRRPQVQEKLTEHIAGTLKKALATEDVAVVIDAVHLCVASSGLNDTSGSTISSHYSGKFKNGSTKKEFLSAIR